MKAPATASARLLRLRWRLTVLFTLMFTPALVIFAVLLVRLDGDMRRQHLADDLRRVGEAVAREPNFQNHKVTLEAVPDDDAFNKCPSFVVLPGSAPAFTPMWSGKWCMPNKARPKDLTLLNGVAAAAIHERNWVARTVSIRGGARFTAVAVTFSDESGDGYGGAVVALGDPDAVDGPNLVVIFGVTAGSILSLVCLALAGRFVAGRMIRPALTALEQQEALLADAAHDLRTPLTTLRTLAETALHDPGQRADLLPRTVTLSARMGGIVDDLLTRARLAAGVERLDRRPLRLDHLVGTLVEEMGVGVRLELEPSVVLADPDLLRRAVANLIENALTHGRPAGGGPPTVTATVRTGGQVTVCDDGPGIDPAQAKKIFERFHSGSRSSGLGLAISRWVAHAHGGTLTVLPSAKGAVFVLTLPALDSGSAAGKARGLRGSASRPVTAAAQVARRLLGWGDRSAGRGR